MTFCSSSLPAHSFKIGELVTVMEAHPAHRTWYGIIVDKDFAINAKPNKEWEKLSKGRCVP